MSDTEAAPEAGRRGAVLESALRTFARTGYRATSMDSVARDARISRPGLYFLFDSKQALFREAVSHVLAQDLAAIEALLADSRRPLRNRLLDAFDRWAGRYLGPMAPDLPAVIAANPDLLDAVATAAPARFEALVTAAIAESLPTRTARALAQTLGSVSVGLKYQVDTRDRYRARLRTAIDLLLS